MHVLVVDQDRSASVAPRSNARAASSASFAEPRLARRRSHERDKDI